MRNRPTLTRGEWLVFGLLAAWSLIPLAAGVAHLIQHGDVLSGTDGIGVLDQYGYLAWVREAGEQGLISNLYDLEDTDAVYLQPMWLISGGLWALGVPIQAAFLIWKPVCLVVLFGGALAWVRRFVEGEGARVAALALALFFLPPLAVLMGRTAVGSGIDDGIVYLFGFEVSPATFLWGYVQTSMAVGLMPVFLLGVERGLRDGAGRRGVIVAAIAGLIVSWVHPWQGMVLLAIAFGVWVWCGPRRTTARLALPVIATVVPLGYFVVLAQIDVAWGEGSENEVILREWPLLLLALAPLLVLALAGAVRGRSLRELDIGERMLLLWPVATLVIYGLLDRTFFYNVLSGITFPLAVLAVRGARGAPRWVAAAAVVLVTLPGLMNVVYEFREGTGAGEGSPRYLTAGEADALEFLDDSPREGGVLARLYLGQAVPSHSGRRTYVGHPVWTPHFEQRVSAAERLLGGELPPARAQAFVRSTGAAFVVQDCMAGRDIARQLGPLVRRAHRFGCATVYEIE